MDYQKQIEKYCPIYYFDSKEKYFPLNINKYIIDKTIEKDVINSCIRKFKDRYWIYYILYYEYDGGKTIFKIDSHINDIEIVILEIINEEINRICFCPHGRNEHFWLNNEDTRKITINNKIKIYVSKSKHAQYPIPGIIWRYYGLCNDTNNNTKNPKKFKIEQLTDKTINSKLFSDKKYILTNILDKEIPTIPLNNIKKRLLYKNFIKI